MQTSEEAPARRGPTKLTWNALASGSVYLVCSVYTLALLPAVALGAIDETLLPSPTLIVVAGVAALALLPFASLGLVALWFSPSSAVRAPDNALLPGVKWLGKAAWSGVIFVFAVVFGAVVGVTASGISDLGDRYASCLARSSTAGDCQRVVSVVQGAGGLNNL